MGITTVSVAALVARAGEGFTWDGPRPGYRPNSKVRRALRAYLHAGQDGLCFDCGQAADSDALEFCHIVSRGSVSESSKGLGWLPGNIALGHRVCPVPMRGNKAQQLRGPVVMPEHVTRPDIVVTEWPAFPVLTAMYP